MDRTVNRNVNRFAFAYSRRILNQQLPSNIITLTTSSEKKPLDSSSYTTWRKNIAILKATNKIN